MRKAARRFGPRLVQRAFEERQIEPLINRITWQLHFWHPFKLRRERERRLECTDAVATGNHRSEAERQVNPFPLIEVAVQLSERGQGIRQAFKVGSLLRLTFLHVLVGLVHAMVSGSSSGPNITRPLRKRMPARPQAAVNAGTLEDAVIRAVFDRA